ncbi:uncharacterized protein LOC124539632 isoform X3 [Vanessa cardui]|uniref:uncharacterized protein LOC124539632 isoform X3 n=1 Tax=Vanessa cardui TaxID=171605 RepID=UPI001F13D429|nr:uncharacterized protein LOC124539632 isoform X3 [Vanessa cardui]
MYLELFLSFILWSNVTLAGDFSKRDIKYLIEVLRRHNRFLDNDKLDAPQSIEELPRAEPIKPGHSLLQPNLDTLKSAARYPQKDVSGTAVYGNLKNLGISYGNSNERVLSTGFRKSNDLLEMQTRRKHHKKKKKSKFRYRDIGDSTTSDSDSSSRSSDFERNPGNPYTVHKDKYQQNWLWNHFMDGDHMNVNPYAPKFSNAGPSGAALFFGRKWWYYNQDDFKPLK